MFDKKAKVICTLMFPFSLVVGAVVGKIVLESPTGADIALFAGIFAVVATLIGLPFGVRGTRRRAISQ